MGYRSETKIRLKHFVILLLLALFGVTLVLNTGCNDMKKREEPPAARIDDVKDTIHGVEVDDPYRWLENWDNPEVQTWSNAENAYAHKYLDALPSRGKIRARINEIMNAKVSRYYSLRWINGELFAMKFQPPLNQSILVVIPSLEKLESERAIVNPNLLDTSGGTSIDWYVPSPDGRLVAVSLSKGGSESGDVHVYETASGRETGKVIKRVNGGTAGGDLAWLPDGSGFYYTRYPRPGEHSEEDINFYQQVWFHQMGKPVETDRYVIGKDFPRIAEIALESDPHSGRLIVQVQYGDSGRFMFFLLQPDGTWQQIATFEDQVEAVVFGKNDDLLLLSRKDAPNGKILLLPADEPVLKKASTLIPEGEQSIVYSFRSTPAITVTENDIYLIYQLGGPNEIRAFDFSGEPLTAPEAPPISSTSEMVALNGNNILFRNSSYIHPSAWYLFDEPTATKTEIALGDKYPFNFGDVEVVREYSTSKDGTRIPVNIIRQKGIQLDGSHPVLLTGYGGFAISRTPRFNPLNLVWLEQGGVFAEANLRGGSEFGEKWHHAGMLTHKQNVFDDFAAAMQHLIDAGYTSPQKLAIIGGSNGGLLMGAMITQHPDLFRATVSQVGLYDMIRSELTSNGQFNIPEYGTVNNPEQFKALLAYSPYHNVKDGVAYPSILFMTGANDPRVNPMHSRKMTARLQAATSSDSPILLRTSATTGHGIGTPLNTLVDEETDIYSFLFHELGMKYHTVK